MSLEDDDRFDKDWVGNRSDRFFITSGAYLVTKSSEYLNLKKMDGIGHAR